MKSDKVKDDVLQCVLELQKERPNYPGYTKEMITVFLRKNAGYGKDKNPDVALAVDYLHDEGFLKASTQNKAKFYRLSSKAQDKILSPSSYGREGKDKVRSFANNGVIIFGDNYGSIQMNNRTKINNKLQSLATAIHESNSITESEKVDLVQSIETLNAQVRRTDPDKTIIERAWGSLQAAATISGASQLVQQLHPLIQSLMTGA